MNRIILASLFCLTLAASPAWADLIAAWDFAGLPATTTDTATPPTISATVGTGLIDISAFVLGDPQGTYPERTAFSGTTLNVFTGGDQTAGMALALANQSANGKSVLFTFGMSGYENLVVSFATRGTSTGFDTGTWSWSTDGISYTTLSGINTATRVTSFAVASVDFSSEFGLNDSPTAYLKYTLSGCTSTSGNNRLDNIQFNASVIPEPSTSVLALAGLASLLVARRRS